MEPERSPKNLFFPFLIVLTVILGFNKTFAQAQGNLTYNWAIKPVPAPQGGNTNATTLARDNSGNIYVAGTFTGTSDFDPTTGVYDLTASGLTDIFLAKYNSSGNLLFAKRIGGTLDEVVNSMVLDTLTGDVFITGEFTGSCDFDPSISSYSLATSSNGYNSDIFIAKYDANGSFVFAKQIGGSLHDVSNSIAIDLSGSIYITGCFDGTVDFDPSVTTNTLSSTGSNEDIYFAKYTSSGSYVYAKAIAGNGVSAPRCIKTDATGAVYITGYFNYTSDFDPSASTLNYVTYDKEIFIAKYNVSGNLVYAKAIGSNQDQEATALAVDNSKNIYITGYFNSQCAFSGTASGITLYSAGYEDIFIAKYDTAGNNVYAKSMGGQSQTECGKALVVDNSGNLYVTGYFNGLADFDPSSATATIQAIYLKDIFIAKYNSTGGYVYAKALQGFTNEQSNAMLQDTTGALYVVGYFANMVDFDPSPSVQYFLSAEVQDAFIAKYGSSGNFVWARTLGGYSHNYRGFTNKIKRDPNGDISILGTHDGTMDFDPTVSTNSLTGSGGFFAKYNATGALVTLKPLPSFFRGDFDAAGSIYIAGNFGGAVDFDLSANTAVLMSGPVQSDAFIAKYDASGNYIYAKSITGNNQKYIQGIKVNAAGEVYITGFYVGTADFDPSSSTVTLTSTGAEDIFIAKYNASGNYVFVKSIGGASSVDYVRGMNLDSSGIYITGNFNSYGTAVDFDPSASSATLSSANYNVYIAKYDFNGNYKYARSIRSITGNTSIFDAIVPDKAGSVFIGGNFYGNHDFDPSSNTFTMTSTPNTMDFFLAKYDSTGNFVFAKGMGGTGADGPHTLAIDTSGSVYITGSFQTTVDFDPSAGTAFLTANNPGDIFIAKYSNSGSYIYAKDVGNCLLNYFGNCITVSPDGSEVFAAGSFSGTSDFDPGTGTANLYCNNYEQYSLFFAKYNSCSAPTAPVNLSSFNALNICSGNATTLTAGGNNILWYSSLTSTVSVHSGTSFITPALASGIVTFYAEANNGCMPNPSRAPITVTVNPTPIISISSGYLCTGSSYTLNPTGAASYTFSGGSGVVSPTINTSYSITGSSAAGCISSNTAIVTVSVVALPTITVNSGVICSGNSFSIVPIGALTYSYSGGSAVVSPASTSLYSVTGVDQNGCVSANIAVSNVSVMPSPTVLLIGGAICSGDSFTLSPSGATSYTYSNGPVVTPIATNNFSVTGTATNGCTNMAVATITVNPLPIISVNSGSICLGKTFTIVPSGAASYSFSGGSAFVSPTANTSYSVFGTSAAGCASSNTAVTTITVLSLPVLSVNSGTICSGQTFTILPLGASTYTYSGGQVVSPLTTTSYSVTGTDGNGCVSVSAVISSVVVNATPIVTVNSGAVCAGASFTFNAGGATSYTYPGGSQIVTPGSSSTYTTIGTAQNGCTSIAVSTITVISLPVVTVNNGTICSGNVFTIVPAGASSYTISGSAWIVSPTVNTTYNVTGTSAQGCISSNVAVSSLTVYNLPVISVNSGSICAGDSFTILPVGASTYSYSGNSQTVSPLSNTNYSVTGYSAEGCSSQIAISSVTVHALPVISVNSGTICTGHSYTLIPSGAFSYSISGGSNIVSPVTSTNYSVTGTSSLGCVSLNPAIAGVTVQSLPVVNVNSGSICSGNSFTISPTGAANYNFSSGQIVSPAVNTSYTVTGSDANGCYSIPAITTVTVLPLPVITVNSGSICSGNIFTIIPSGALTYTYSAGTATVAPLTTTSYSVTGTGINGCPSWPVLSLVQVKPSPVLSIGASSANICAGENAILSAAGAVTYTWSTNETSQSIVISPTLTSNYTVTGTAVNGCSGFHVFTQLVDPCTGSEELARYFNNLRVYPNPNTGEFIIETSAATDIDIYNSIGQLILKVKSKAGKNDMTLNDASKGIYFLQFRSKNDVKTIKIVRQ